MKTAIIKGKSQNKKASNGGNTRVIIKQNIKILKKELLKLANKSDIDKIATDNWIEITETNNRINLINEVITESIKRKELIEIYKKHAKKKREKAFFYTDGSALRESYNTRMGSAWIRVPTENSKDIISSFKTANVGWPSLTKAELLAIYLALLTTEENCIVEIFTDSQNAISQFNKFKYETSVRRKNKIHNHILIEAIMKIVKIAKIDLKLTKVKAHDGIWGNEIVDDLAKQGLYDDRIITRDIGNENNFRLGWYGHKVEHNNRKFVKMLNKVKTELKENNLNRMKNLEVKYNKKVTFDILNKDNEIAKEKKGKFFSIKGNKYRTFKVKKLFNELLTLENLKRRMPKLYKKNMLCPRCNEKK